MSKPLTVRVLNGMLRQAAEDPVLFVKGVGPTLLGMKVERYLKPLLRAARRSQQRQRLRMKRQRIKRKF